MKKQIFSTLVFAMCLILPFSVYSQEQRKKVGVVLSGGGAKGVAHIKALKVIEEAGIPIDYIVGTSMGSIVGGLYAIGYTPEQLDSMVRKQDWTFLLSDRIKRSAMSLTERERSAKYIVSLPFTKNPKAAMSGGIIKGQNLANLFSDLTVGYHDSINFNKLPIPFACVSANVVNGDQIVFHDGVLSTAMRASMAIPGVFTPVRKDSMVLVDGGIVNNYPADVAKAMGADIIIGVDVQNALKSADKLNSAPDILGQIVDLTCQTNHEKNVELTDTYIKVNVDGFSSASFTPAAIDSLMRRGEEAARAQWNSLIALKKEIGIPDNYVPKQHGPYSSLSNSRTVYVTDISFSGVEADDKKWLMKKCNLKENSNITTQQIEQAVYQLRGSHSYSSASYTLTDTPEGYHLNFLLEEKYEKRINLGIRFDSEEMASILLNTTLSHRALRGSRLSITGRLNKNPYVLVDYSFGSNMLRKLGVSYMFKYNDINLYDKKDKVDNITFSYHRGDLNLSDIYFRNFKFQLGLRYEYFNYKSVLYNTDYIAENLKSQGFASYYALAHFDTYDKKYFPDKGMSFRADYSLYTDNMVNYDGHAPFSALSADFEPTVRLTRRVYLLPALYGRVLIGRDIAIPYLNYVGGEVAGRYMNQQLPFYGIHNLQVFDNSVVVGRLQLRYRLGMRHYITLTGNYAKQSESFFDILKGDDVWGGGAGYAYNSIIGPISVTFDMSNWDQKLGVYFNLGYYF